MHALLCPACGYSTLSTIEQLFGYAGAAASRDDTGEVKLVWDGDTRMDWDSSTTVGIMCDECGWEYWGDDWDAQLLPEPSLARVIGAVLAHIDALVADGSADPFEWQDQTHQQVLDRLLREPDTPVSDPRALFLANILASDLDEERRPLDDVRDLFEGIVALWAETHAATT